MWGQTLGRGAGMRNATSPPVPRSLRERGHKRRHQLLEPCTCHILVRDPEDPLAGCSEPGGARGVVARSSHLVVTLAVELQDQLELGAKKVRDETVEHMLAPELEAKQLSIPQQGPRVAFRGGRRTAQLAGEGTLACRRSAAETHPWPAGYLPPGPPLRLGTSISRTWFRGGGRVAERG